MNKKIGFYFLLAVNFALVIFIAFLIIRKEHFKNLVPFISQGEKLPEIVFIDESNQTLNTKQYQERPILLFVFERPCSTCTKNIVFWNKLYELANKKAYVFGVIQDLSDMFEIAKIKKIPFKLMSPANFDVFKKKWRVHLNLSQTYLIYKNKVKLINVGAIGADDMKEIFSMLNELEAK
ncbi:MAG: redoxin family protein [Candidatus Aminicenantes bacterium]|nr:redoxin family protein [Candidatus Aminicenantes bacterium]